MKIHCPNRTCKKRITESLSPQYKACIHFFMLRNGIHLHTDFLPFIKIADGCIPHPFRSRSRHLIPACPSIAHHARFTIFPNILFCICYYFLVCHPISFFLYHSLFLSANKSETISHLIFPEKKCHCLSVCQYSFLYGLSGYFIDSYFI